MRNLRNLVLIISSMLISVQLYTQNVGIGANTFTPDNSALLELKSTSAGLLIPRMTTAERDAISSPAQSLMIYNLTTKCLEIFEDNTWQAIWCSCIGFSITASASSSSICNGASSTLTAGGASTYTWSHSLGSGASKTVTPSATTTYTVTGTSTLGCTNTATVKVTVKPTPTVTATASPSAICNGESSVITASGASTYSWSHSLGSGSSKTVTPSATTTYTVTGTSTAGCSSTATVQVTVKTFTCGDNLTVTHTAAGVAPVNKTVTYRTVLTDLTGTNKCWITQNLGASNQATKATDNTEAAAGWYWQFNRKQGYKHDGTNRTPNTWISSIDENRDWTSVNDPCTILLGTGWRIPTKTEWENADANGGWGNYKNTYYTVLKLHAAGFLSSSDGSLRFRGSNGDYWSSTQYSSTRGWYLGFASGYSYINYDYKALGCSVRCLRD